MSKWQPIETAPKDGTIVDLWFPLLDDDGDYEEEDIVLSRVADCHFSKKGNCWVNDVGFNLEIDFDGPPTYWMPLPKPPSIV